MKPKYAQQHLSFEATENRITYFPVAECWAMMCHARRNIFTKHNFLVWKCRNFIQNIPFTISVYKTGFHLFYPKLDVGSHKKKTMAERDCFSKRNIIPGEEIKENVPNKKWKTC